MTAIDQKFCYANPLSCGAIQNVLEKSPGLVFVNGEFRHKYSLVPPSPPPDPSPPPREFAYAPHPPLPPPPPVNPPPFYEDAEDCLPLPRLSDYGLDIKTDAIDGAETEERASCIFARRVLDEKRRAKACFAHIAFPYPPPPPVMAVHDTAAAASQWRQRERLGDLEAYEAPRKTDRAQWADDTAGAMLGTEALIDALGENNPILRDLLATAKQEIYRAGTENAAEDPEAAAAYAAATGGDATSGRRLMQRKEYNVRMTDALITAEIMEFYGKGGIPGVTAMSCEALCEATAQVDDVHPTAVCKAYAFKRAAPFSYVDKTGWCYLLQNAGACKIGDFGVELYTRQIESERQCSATAPGLDNPLCVGLPSTRDDARLLTHADAAAMAAQLPDNNHPAPGAGGLPLPRTVVESMSMLAFARQQGVTAFWGASPNTDGGDVHMHWPTEDSSTLIYRQGESRCVLIASGLGPRAHMYAHLKPCDSKQASGLVTVAAAAAPPPPPGAQARHFYDPVRAPPPPPSVKRAALEVFVRKEIRPRVVAICEGGLEGLQHREVCMAVAGTLSKYQPIAGYGMIAPFCEKVCWHSCNGESHAGGLDDGFSECPSETCAQDSCLDFLLRECPPVLHADIQNLYDSKCTLTPPSPPRPPAPPPPPTGAFVPSAPSPPPPPPPPAPYYQERSRDDEKDYDPDCELVSYATCKGIVADYAAAFGTANVLRVSFAPCEGTTLDEGCFRVRMIVVQLPHTPC